MLISRTGSYALQACRYLATHADNGFIPVSKISNELHLSSGQYLTKVMQRLKAKKIVQTSKGPHGGVRLSKPADIILLMDIIEAADSQAYQDLLQNKRELLFPESPILNQNYRFLEAKFYSGLKQTTLDQFSKQKQITNIPLL